MKVFQFTFLAMSAVAALLADENIYTLIDNFIDMCTNNSMGAATVWYRTRSECAIRCLVKGCRSFALTSREGGGYVCDMSHQSRNVNGRSLQVFTAIDHSHLRTNDWAALISGPQQSIPDESLTVSSAFVQVIAGDHGPACSRLGIPRPPSCYCEGWAAGSGTVGEWIQADLWQQHVIHSVLTAGRGMDHGGVAKHMRVTSYKIGVMCDNDTIAFYQKNGQDKIFVGNLEDLVVVQNELSVPMVGRYVRIYPQTWNGYMILRWELYGKVLV